MRFCRGACSVCDSSDDGCVDAAGREETVGATLECTGMDHGRCLRFSQCLPTDSNGFSNAEFVLAVSVDRTWFASGAPLD